MHHDAINPLDQLYPIAQVSARACVPSGQKLRTVCRWYQNGIGGVKLRVSKVGGRVYTCDRWLLAFFDRDNPQPKPVSPAGRARRHKSVMRELEAAGI